MEYTWYALVEENTFMSGITAGDTYAWRVSQMIPLPPGADPAELAKDVAFRFQPVRPSMPRRRSVFRINDESFLVRIEGATSVHHFRVTMAEHVAELDAQGHPINPGQVARAE
jgi:hypothetical protein